MLKKAIAIIVAQVVLFLALVGLFELQMGQEKNELIMRSSMVALFYANPAHSYPKSYRREFLDPGYSGPQAMFGNPFSVKNASEMGSGNFSEFAVILKEDVDKAADPHLKHAFYYPQANKVQQYKDSVAINLPLYREGDKEPYGLIRIEHNLRNLPRDIFYKNLLSYGLIELFFNGFLIALLFGLFKKPKETVVYLEKGYLKEYALGALKLHHKILGQIIDDHNDPAEKKDSPEITDPAVLKFDPQARRRDNKL